MDRSALRANQAPLKERFRSDPGSAVVVLTACGDVSRSEISCSVQTGRSLVEAGLHELTGGAANLACSGDMLLQALVACAGVTLKSVAINRGVDVYGTIRAHGTLDFRGTLGVDREAPVGFSSIRLAFDLNASCDSDALKEIVSTTERYCVVWQTLMNSPAVDTELTE